MTRAQELTLKLLDGDITPVEQAELEWLVDSDPEAAKEHTALLEQEAVLRGATTPSDLTAPTLERIRQTLGKRIHNGVMARVQHERPRAWHRFWPLAAAAAVLIVLAGALLHTLRTPQTQRQGPQPRTIPTWLLARVDGAVGVRAGHAAWSPGLAGDAVASGTLVRVSAFGQAHLAAQGCELVLGPGTQVKPAVLASGGGPGSWVQLVDGSVQVANAHGMALQTDQGRIILWGEGCVVQRQGVVRIEVRQGQAEVQWGAGKKRSLKQGERAQLTNGALSALPADAPIDSLPQRTDAKDEAIQPQVTGKLVLRDSQGRETEPLEVRELRVHTRIDGPVALTEIEQTFFNPTNRRAEGTFYFPLPAGASISRFAMYVDGKLVEGELVDRTRAREVYEEIVRHMQDPALMEWQEGNVFKTRIFPIPAKAPKRIIIHYTQLLRIRNGERRYLYPLVSKTTQTTPMGRFAMKMEIADADDQALVRVPAYPQARIDWPGRGAEVSFECTNFLPKQDFVVRYAPKRDQALQVLTDRRKGEDGFVLISYVPPVESDGGVPRGQGRDLLVLFDTSLSRRPEAYRAQLKALETILTELGPGDRFAVISFDAVCRTHQESFQPRGQDATEILQTLQKIRPLGATNLEAAFKAAGAFLNKNPARDRADVILLSDGIATMGETESARLVDQATTMLASHQARLHGVAVGAKYEKLLLETLARRSGGLFRTISPGDTVAEEVFALMLDLDTELVPAPAVTFAGEAIDELYPRKPGTLVPGEEMILLGRYDTPGETTITLTPQEGAPVSHTIRLPETNSTHVFVPRLWARARLDHLLLRKRSREQIQEIKDLSQEFTIITPYTSFLVLENEEAYTRYGIVRSKRRRYWEEAGKLRTAPPEPEPAQAQPTPPARHAQSSRPPQPQPEKKPETRPKVKPFTLADLDLSLLTQRFGDRREVATALGALCLQCYYRYSNVHSPGSGGNTRAPDASPATENEPTPAVDTDFELTEREAPEAPVQMSEMTSSAERVSRPVPTDTTPAQVDNYMQAQTEDRTVDTGGEDFLRRVPLEGANIPAVEDGTELDNAEFGWRTGGGRRRVVARGGGSRYTESAVDWTLRYLARVQRSDGRLGVGGMEETSWALLAFLGAGNSIRFGKYKGNVQKCVAWLRGMQEGRERLGLTLYEQAVATMALGEAYGMSNDQSLKAPVQAALAHLLAAQRPDGGWGAQRSHPLVSGMAVLAMNSCKVAGITVPPANLRTALHYFQGIVGETGAVGPRGKPQGNEIDLLHTAVALTSLQLLGRPRTDDQVERLATVLVRNHEKINANSADGRFVLYFGTAGLFQFGMGSDHWRKWDAWMKRLLLSAQVKSGPFKGSWPPTGIWILGMKPFSDKDADKKILAGIVKMQATPNSKAAYEELALALASTSDLTLLQTLLAKPEAELAGDARLMVDLRFAMLQVQYKQWADAIRRFAAVYTQAGQPENVLKVYVGTLHHAGKTRQAMDLLLGRERLGLSSDWQRRMVGTLLYDEAAAVADPVAYVSQHLGAAVKRVELKVVLAQMAKDQGERKVEARFYEQVYAESDRDEKYTRPLVEALCGAERQPDAETLLINEAGSEGRTSRWRLDTLAGLLLDKKAGVADVSGRIQRKLAKRPKIRVALLVRTGQKAEEAKNLVLAASLFEQAYLQTKKRERYGRDYVRLLRKTDQQDKAYTLLREEAQNENRLSKWRMTVLAEMLIKQQDFKADPMAGIQKLLPERPRAQLALMLAVARVANTADNAKVAAALYGHVYQLTGRPRDLVERWIKALLNAGQHDQAEPALEDVIQGGYHTRWAFSSLGQVYQALHRGDDAVLRAVSCEVEIFPRDVHSHQVMAGYFQSHGQQKAALKELREVLKLRPEDVKVYRRVIEQALRAKEWDLLTDMLRLMFEGSPRLEKTWGGAGLPDLVPIIKALPQDPDRQELLKELDAYRVLDLVVVMRWDTKTDIDLHIREPTGEECDYQHKDTGARGWLDHDDTDGYGPETYTLRRTAPGTYKIDVLYFSGTPKTKVDLDVYRFRYGQQESKKSYSVTLTKTKERKTVVTVEVPKGKVRRALRKDALSRKPVEKATSPTPQPARARPEAEEEPLPWD